MGRLASGGVIAAKLALAIMMLAWAVGLLPAGAKDPNNASRRPTFRQMHVDVLAPASRPRFGKCPRRDQPQAPSGCKARGVKNLHCCHHWVTTLRTPCIPGMHVAIDQIQPYRCVKHVMDPGLSTGQDAAQGAAHPSAKRRRIQGIRFENAEQDLSTCSSIRGLPDHWLSSVHQSNDLSLQRLPQHHWPKFSVEGLGEVIDQRHLSAVVTKDIRRQFNRRSQAALPKVT